MQVIQDELYRNIALAFACVLIMTLILLANVWSCFIVCACVIMCLVRVQFLEQMSLYQEFTKTHLLLLLSFCHEFE